MKKYNRAGQGRRSDQIRRQRLEKQSEWLHSVDERAEHMATHSAAESFVQNQRDFHTPASEQNPLAHIAYDQKDYTAPKIRLSWRYLSAVVAILSGIFLFSAWRSPDYHVSDFEIEGIQRVTKEEVAQVLDLNQRCIFLLSPQEFEQAISNNFPELYQVQISLAIPAKMIIQVREREPSLVWNYQGKQLWVDPQGYLLPMRGEAQISVQIDADDQLPFYIPEDRIILQGEKRLRKTVVMKGENDTLALFKVYQRIDPVTYQAIHELNQLLPEQGVILYDTRRGLGWNDPRGFQVFVGSDLKDIAAKMKMLDEIVKTMIHEQIIPTLISIEHINAPYYRQD